MDIVKLNRHAILPPRIFLIRYWSLPFRGVKVAQDLVPNALQELPIKAGYRGWRHTQDTPVYRLGTFSHRT